MQGLRKGARAKQLKVNTGARSEKPPTGRYTNQSERRTPQEALDVNLIVAKNRHGGTGRLVVPVSKWCSLFSNEMDNPEE